MNREKIEQAKTWAIEANREMKRIRDRAEQDPLSIDTPGVIAETMGAVAKTAAATNLLAEVLLEA